MNKISFVALLALACSSLQTTAGENNFVSTRADSQTPSHPASPPQPLFSESICWQSFQPYLFDDDLYRASSRFQLKTTPECYQYATQKAAIEKIIALREKTIEKYQERILQYENNPKQSYVDDLCQAEKKIMKQSYDLITALTQIYQDTSTKTETHFPWIKSSAEYQQEKQRFHKTLNAINTSLQRPYCDSNEFEADIHNIK